MKVVITGGTKGIGLSLAEEFLERGDAVCVCSRSQDHVDSAKEELSKQFPGSQIVGKTCDVTSEEDLSSFVQFANQKLNGIDVWVNNAGTKGNTAGHVYEISEGNVRLPIETNLIGSLFGTRAALSVMLKQGSGRIFNMEGLGSNGRASPANISYGASKAALPQVLKTLKKELKGTGVFINNISPGMVLTDLLLKNNRSEDESAFRKVVNILAEKPKTVAKFLVPRMRKVKKSGKRIQFLTNLKAAWRFMTAWRYKNRWFDEQGNKKF